MLLLEFYEPIEYPESLLYYALSQYFLGCRGCCYECFGTETSPTHTSQCSIISGS